MEEELVRTKRHWGKQIVGEFLEIKRHVAEIWVQSCLRESRTRSDEIQVVCILWRRNGTGLKKASYVVLVKSALEKTARGDNRRAKLF
ncbi:hypothetical protein T11_10079 [Trichinella zimbabwensis]|uniref:Uncharacterized protein n=1 Tax=Trichinella zimbabwensis TaxID=268475 RepID=A0A0V1GGI0_9BILA|nr:hypothetical protein T11_10079 [Trichinella zimbabwensis]